MGDEFLPAAILAAHGSVRQIESLGLWEFIEKRVLLIFGGAFFFLFICEYWNEFKL